jgi:hypothetical protein
MQRSATVFLVWFSAFALASAADFWTVKPYTAWTEKEARTVMEDSPWAALVSAALPPAGPVPTVDAVGGRGGGGGGGRGDDFGAGPRRVRVTISWRSSLAVKQALTRAQMGSGSTPPPEAEAFLSREELFYVVGLEGIPPQYVRPGSGTTVESFLRRNGKPPIPAQQAGAQPGRGPAMLLIAFPRTDAITLEDGEVEFTAKWGVFEVKKKFKLKDMVFEGKLAL